MISRVRKSGVIICWCATLAAAVMATGIAIWQSRQERVKQTALEISGPDVTSVKRDIDLCAQRLKRLGQVLKLYAADYEGSFPVGIQAGEAFLWLPPLLEQYAAEGILYHCPTSEPQGPPYVYHSYIHLGPGDWPRWMASKHLVSEDSDPDTWLMADYLDRQTEGPHAPRGKAFNYLTAAGRVAFHQGHPRDVYK
ncbi:MAG: hypothetical protein ACUVX8_00625 [Candidatus Zipacnadales bacterium]